jgi:hypothetical protein
MSVRLWAGGRERRRLELPSFGASDEPLSRCREQVLQPITWPSTFADHQGKQRSAWRSLEDC